MQVTGIPSIIREMNYRPPSRGRGLDILICPARRLTGNQRYEGSAQTAALTCRQSMKAAVRERAFG
jgi:hypothetical protein